jgi:HSP20 family molecular chaperone IbpA
MHTLLVRNETEEDKMFHLTRRPTRRLSSFLDLDKDIQSFFDTIPSWESVDRTTHLACDVKETKDKFILSFDTPGVEKDDIHIEVSKGKPNRFR